MNRRCGKALSACFALLKERGNAFTLLAHIHGSPVIHYRIGWPEVSFHGIPAFIVDEVRLLGEGFGLSRFATGPRYTDDEDRNFPSGEFGAHGARDG
jgi:hypothetical protein